MEQTISKRIRRGTSKLKKLLSQMLQTPDRNLHDVVRERQERHPNPFAKYGRKCFSQSDEDGITMEIVRRLGIRNGTFIEFGVGNGTENNTLILTALDWKGVWFGGVDLAVDCSRSERLHFEKSWITRESIAGCYRRGCDLVGASSIDLISLDLDGNDLFFCEELLSNGAVPKVFIAEYNAKFPPPVEFAIKYDANHVWDGSDYMGASLSSLVNLFNRFDYALVCCNAGTGANAFFVKKEYLGEFPEVPSEIGEIYAEPFFHVFGRYGHPSSTKTIEWIINR